MPLCVQRGLKREGVSLWFLAAHRAAEAKLGLVSLTSNPQVPAALHSWRGSQGRWWFLSVPPETTQTERSNGETTGPERFCCGFGPHYGNKIVQIGQFERFCNVMWHVGLLFSSISATERFLVQALWRISGLVTFMRWTWAWASTRSN